MNPAPIDPNAPFTRDLLHSVTATLRAQADETDAEYAERFAAATTAVAAFRPRDPVEQMLAAHIVAAQYAGLDCLNRAMEAENPLVADKLRRSFAAMNLNPAVGLACEVESPAPFWHEPISSGFSCSPAG